jgi:hypothetical protein
MKKLVDSFETLLLCEWIRVEEFLRLFMMVMTLPFCDVKLCDAKDFAAQISLSR